MPEAVIIGGPNGAGKTSWAQRYLQPTLGIDIFINADEIARELVPLNPDRAALAAGRLLIQRARSNAEAGRDFALESTCAGKSHIRLFAQWRARGYRITLIFLSLPSADAAVRRVRHRVSLGGHSVPEDVIRRRFRAGLRNLRQIYLPNSDVGLVYDNVDQDPCLIAEHTRARSLVIHDPVRWARIEDLAQ